MFHHSFHFSVTHWKFLQQPKGRVHGSPWGSDITQQAIVPFLSWADVDVFANV